MTIKRQRIYNGIILELRNNKSNKSIPSVNVALSSSLTHYLYVIHWLKFAEDKISFGYFWTSQIPNIKI